MFKIIRDDYCIVIAAIDINDIVNLSLEYSYYVTSANSTNFILLMLISNLDYSQNDLEIGIFNVIVTMQIYSHSN